ncbi:FeoB-associated Cys-rich membrane protein [Boudabousia marimammalium]|uniref:FeoB-associated Cys-rich membrane protein n=1 Tax=Boudabousia marimammalium TaxID=156892 RepID=UPI003CCB7B2A
MNSRSLPRCEQPSLKYVKEYEEPMTFSTLIALIAVISLVGWAIWYVVKEKRKGTVCIGCPVAGSCSKVDLCETSTTTPDGRIYLPITPVPPQKHQ